MRTIVAGSRDWVRPEDVVEACEAAPWPISVVLSGTARGTDRYGEAWARSRGIPVERYPAAWDRDGKRAGMLRNLNMIKRAEALVAVWNGTSPGTRHVITHARKAGLRVHVHYIRLKGEA